MYELLPKGFTQTKPTQTQPGRPGTARQTQPQPSALPVKSPASSRTLTKREKAAVAATRPAAAAPSVGEQVTWPFANIGGKGLAGQLLQTFWKYSDQTTRQQMAKLSEQLRKNQAAEVIRQAEAKQERKQYQAVHPAERARDAQNNYHAENDRYRLAENVQIVITNAGNEGANTGRTDKGYLITLHPADDRPLDPVTHQRSSGPLFLNNPLNVSILTDELYTVYQAEISHAITYERVGENTFLAQGYDLMDELQTKIVAALALYRQGKGADYLRQLPTYPTSTSKPSMVAVLNLLQEQHYASALTVQNSKAGLMRQPLTKSTQLLRLLLDIAASLPQPTVQGVQEALRANRSIQPILWELGQKGYFEDVAISYKQDKSSRFTSGDRGLAYVERKIVYQLNKELPGQQKSKRYQELFDERLKAEKKKLSDQGVMYEYEPVPELNLTPAQ